MTQYREYSEGEYVEYLKSGVRFRDGMRNKKFVLDKALTSKAFEGVENTDWVNVEERIYSANPQAYRDGVRNNGYVIDYKETGSETWVNAEEHK